MTIGMVWIRQISFMLFLVLGLNLVAESFASALPEDHRAAASANASVDSDFVSAASSADASNIDHHCGDFCHVGSCHFGHCSHQLAASPFFFLLSEQVSSKFFGLFNEPASPFLDRVKQPPRLA